MATLPDGFLDAVKNYLDITWTDDAGDEKLSGIIARGIKYIDGAAGEPLDYTTEDKPKELLVDYCRYVRSNALHEFLDNYLPEITRLQNEYEIRRFATLSAINIGTLTLSPEFKYATMEYTAETTNSEDIIAVTAMQSTATVEILNGVTEVTNGAAATWTDGENTVTITVTCGGISKIYTMVVTKV
jgi:hypothetical protein